MTRYRATNSIPRPTMTGPTDLFTRVKARPTKRTMAEQTAIQADVGSIISPTGFSGPFCRATRLFVSSGLDGAAPSVTHRSNSAVEPMGAGTNLPFHVHWLSADSSPLEFNRTVPGGGVT